MQRALPVYDNKTYETKDTETYFIRLSFSTSGCLLEAGTFPKIQKTGHFSSPNWGWAFIRAWAFIRIFTVFVYYKYRLLKKSVYCINNVFLHLLVSKSFVTTLISLFKYKLFRKIIVFNFIVFRICLLQVLAFQKFILLY